MSQAPETRTSSENSAHKQQQTQHVPFALTGGLAARMGGQRYMVQKMKGFFPFNARTWKWCSQ
jgi:hypothetical protein